MARACRTSAVDQTGRACSPPDHPARFKVENVARQVSWLAPAPGTVIRTGLGRRRLPALGAVAVSTHRWCLQLRGQPRLEPRSRLSSGLAEEPRTAKATQWPSGGQPLSRLWGRRGEHLLVRTECVSRPGAARCAKTRQLLAPCGAGYQVVIGHFRSGEDVLRWRVRI
jgi:hypothetical protein